MEYMHMSGLATIIGLSGLVALAGIVVIHCFDKIVEAIEWLFDTHQDYIP